MSVKKLTTNRRARFDYEILKTFVAGIVLSGQEVKSLRNNGGDLKGSYVLLKDDSAWLMNSHIKAYSHANNIDSYDTTQLRKLLLNKKELAELSKEKLNGRTIIPLSFELHGKLVKVLIATARGKKQTDKRQSIKKHDTDLDAQREMKQRH